MAASWAHIVPRGVSNGSSGFQKMLIYNPQNNVNSHFTFFVFFVYQYIANLNNEVTQTARWLQVDLQLYK